MSTQLKRQSTASIMAEFDNQDDADEALLELRLAGIKDKKIAYYSPMRTGVAEDLLERNYWILGATTGTIAGIGIGIWLARAIPQLESSYLRGLDSFGLLTTCISFAMLAFGTVGGVIGSAIPRRKVVIPVPEQTISPFVIGVDEEESRDRVGGILSRHGGHQVQPNMA